jgi:prophage regulatory protein
MSEAPTATRFMSMAEVEQATSYDQSSIYRLIKAGEFCEPIQLGPRRIAFVASEVEAWLSQRAAKGREKWRANRPQAQAAAKARARAGGVQTPALGGGHGD